MKCKYFGQCGSVENCSQCPELLKQAERERKRLNAAIAKKRSYLKQLGRI